jgi:PadR family transcriptional regulator PadR
VRRMAWLGAVAEWIEYATRDALSVEEGTLYPALHRLERKGWVESEWGISENNRRAKFYRHTTAGHAQFRAGAPAWHRYAEAIAAALRATSPDVVST